MTEYKVLDDLYEIIKERKNGDPAKSYAASLFEKGRKKITQKLGEEAVETVIEGMANKKKGTIEESADLLFHLLVLWADMKIKPEQVMKELKKREGKSGIAEKNARKK